MWKGTCGDMSKGWGEQWQGESLQHAMIYMYKSVNIKILK